MGACRTLNVLLGMSLSPDPWQAVHWVAGGGRRRVHCRRDVVRPHRSRAPAVAVQLRPGLVILLAGIGLVASMPRLGHGRRMAADRAARALVSVLGPGRLVIGWRCRAAVIEPRPADVQAAVRNCIFSLIILDAAAVLAVQDRCLGAGRSWRC